MLSKKKVLEYIGDSEKTVSDLTRCFKVKERPKMLDLLKAIEKEGYITLRKPWFREIRAKRTGKIYSKKGCETIAVVNLKGGVGKTTTSVNLSANLSKSGKKVLLVDLDPQANSTFCLVPGNPGAAYKALSGEGKPDELIMRTNHDNLSILPSDLDLAGAEAELSGEEGMTRLRDFLAPVLEKNDYIVIDCPPSLSLLTLNALCAADSLIIPVECDRYGMESIRNLKRVLEEMRDYNPELTIKGIIITKFNHRDENSVSVEQEIRRAFPKLVFDFVVPYDEGASFSCMPDRISKEDLGATKAYEKLAAKVMSNE